MAKEIKALAVAPHFVRVDDSCLWQAKQKAAGCPWGEDPITPPASGRTTKMSAGQIFSEAQQALAAPQVASLGRESVTSRKSAMF